MKTLIVKGLDEREAEEMRQSFVAGAFLRKRIRELLKEKADVSVAASRAKDSYNNPNWAYLQADAVGYQRAMHEIISLLTNESKQESEASLDAELLPHPKKRGRPVGSKNRQPSL
jgi:hypothetical protein